MRTLLASFFVVVVFSLLGCKTMNALNSDIKSTGQAIGKGISKAGEAITKTASE